MYAQQKYYMYPFCLYVHADPKTVIKVGSLPEPDLYHHIVEDFVTDW